MQSAFFTTTDRAVVLIPISLIRPHERHDHDHASALQTKIRRDQVFTHPVCLDRASLTLLDGHHRYRASLALGLSYLPSVLVDYWAADITVSAWRDGEIVTRDTVLASAETGALMPIKTSRHTFDIPIGICNVPLGRLTLDQLDELIIQVA